MSATTRLNMTLMSTSSLQKEVIFNELAIILDALCQPSAKSVSVTADPATPAMGDLYLLPAGCTGAWAGHDNTIAVYLNGWRFITPVGGMFVHVVDVDTTYRFDTATSTWVENALSITGLGSIPGVDLTGLADKMHLVYDATSLTWKVQLVATTDLADVDQTGLADGYVMQWNATAAKWLVAAVPSPSAATIKTLYESNADTNAFTDALKTKLAGLESSHFKGTYTSLSALNTAYPTATDGDYAHVDAGVGSNAQVYIWDTSDGAWVASTSSATYTAADIKTLYESNADTNAFTDADVTKLGGIDTGANVNPDLLVGGTNVVTAFKKINFVSGASAAPNGIDPTQVDVTISGGGGGSVPIGKDGTTEVATPDKINFIGAGVSVVPNGTDANQADVTIPGSFIDMPAVNTTTAYSVTNTDLAGDVVQRFNNAAAVTVTVPSGLTGKQPYTAIQTGAGTVSFAAGAGVTIQSRGALLGSAGQYGVLTLIPDADTADLYYLTGDLA